MGNMLAFQKALFAKWLVEPPAVFLIDEPTRGVDIAAKANIHNLILELAELHLCFR